ncbi:MAG: ATP-binding cassette domain-containing protein [Proteobacteria bacterium]|nr:ATP-binding cassette domain-containing protein [Pseudomonadota bacterium]
MTTATLPPMLAELHDVTVRYAGRPVLDHVDLSIARGQIVTVIGPNGSGKTTLARVLLGLIEADSGRVRRMDDIVIGYVPQRMHIDSSLPLSVRRFLQLAAPRRGREIDAALDETGARPVVEADIGSLSGGELQRVLLARALLRDPDLLVLDEPAQGVDFSGQTALYHLIGEIRDRHKCGVLTISHDLHLVMAATDRVTPPSHHICCSGEPESVRIHPEYVALFGPAASKDIAIYSHSHCHSHDLAGNIVEPENDHAHHHHSPQ